MLQRFATIRARILLLAACGIIACGLVTGLAVHALDHAQEDYTEMVSHSLTGKIATLSIARDMNYISRLTRNMMLGSNLEKDTERLEKTSRSMRDGFNELHQAATTQEERDRIAQAEQSTMRFSQETLAFARSLVEVPVEERHLRHKEYQKIVTPLAETSRKHFEELEALEDKAFDNSLATYDNDLRSGRTMLLWLSGGVVGALLLLGAAIVRSIVRPLSAATAYARAVEAGNFDDIDADRFGGEIRVLLGSMRSMVAELKRRIGFAQGVLRSLPLPCAILDTDGRVQWANDALAQLSGAHDAKGLVGGAGAAALPSPHAVALCDDALRRDTVRRAELPLDDEGARVVDLTASPVHDLDGAPLGVMACMFDLSELRNQQRMVLDRNRILAEAADNACSVSRKVVDSTTAVDGNVRDSLRRADMQGSRTAEVAVAVEQMNASVAEVARSASMAASSAEDAHTRAAEGRDVVQRAVSAMAEVDDQAQRLRSEMGELAAKAEGIGRIVGVITDIADQTNLLALNAAIEAARAGDAGRGFAVVADEVRKLAEKTMTATREVEGFVRSMQESSHRSVRATEETTATAGRASGLAADAGDALAAILGITSTTADQVRAIATASEEQSAASEQIARSTTEIRAAAGETSDALRGIERAMGDVRRMSDELSSIVTTMRA